MSIFLNALAYTLQNEGVYSADPADPGGATKYGITIGTLSRWRQKPVAVDMIANLTIEEASAIYEAYYWKPIGCSAVVQPIATAMFDVGVLFGIGVSTMYAQKAVTQCGFTLAIDGHIGPSSVLALNKVNPANFIAAFTLMLKNRVADIILERPESERFRRGWGKRLDRLTTLVKTP